MRKSQSILAILAFAFLVLGASKAPGELKLPKKVEKAFKKALKKGEFKNPYNLQIIDQMNFLMGGGQNFVVLLFKGNVPGPKEGENNYLYARVIRKDGGYMNLIKVVKGKAKDFYSFAVLIAPGNYRFLMGVGDKKGKKFSMIMTVLNVPSLGKPGEITYSKPMFIKNFTRGDRQEVLGAVIPDAFYSGMIKIIPYRQYKFKSDEQPTVFMYLYGLGKDETGLAKGTVTFTIMKGGKEYVKFKGTSLKGRGGIGIIDQPILLKKENKPLPKGNYQLKIKVKDELLGKEVEINLPFEVI